MVVQHILTPLSDRRTRNSREYMPSWNGGSKSCYPTPPICTASIFDLEPYTRLVLVLYQDNSRARHFKPSGGSQDAQFERVHAELERRFKQQQQLLLKNRMYREREKERERERDRERERECVCERET